MTRISALLAIAIGAGALAFAPTAGIAQQKAQSLKAGKGEKVCRVKLKFSGETKSWVCKKEEPCCVWHEINYVKCGSTITGCL